jgi:putative effector of murein hydrolase
MSITILVFQTIRIKERFREIFAYPEILLISFICICINLINIDADISDNMTQIAFLNET